MKFKLYIIYWGLIPILLTSCQNDTLESKSFLLINKEDSVYYQFKLDDSLEVQAANILDDDLHYKLYPDSVIAYCLESKVYTSDHKEDIMSIILEGNEYSSTLMKYIKEKGQFKTDSSRIEEVFIGDYLASINKVTIKEGEFLKFCEIKTINQISDTSCFKFKPYPFPSFNWSEYTRVPGPDFKPNCPAITGPKNKTAILDYLEDLSLSIEKDYLLIDFFTYYCAPCIKAIPKLNKMNKYDNLEVIGIHSFLKDKSRLEKFKKTFDPNYSLYGEETMYYFGEEEIRSHPRYLLLETDPFRIIRDWSGYQEGLDNKIREAITTYEDK